jgi:isopenicillin N synthase-like dioxygenase
MKILKIDLQSKTAGRDLVESFKNTGFAIITNHDIPAELITKTYQEWELFFKSDVKLNYKFNPKSSHQSGFFPFKSENAKDNPVKDLKEFFHIYNESQYPQEFSMKDSEQLRKKLELLGFELLSLLAENTDPEIFQSSESLIPMVYPDNVNLFRVLHYPPLGKDAEAGAIRASAHEDINLITLLPAATQSGLEVKDIDGNWHAVQSDFGNIIVNVGDMLELASNNYFKSTTHQVVNPTGEDAAKPRYSMPLFIAPREDVELSPTKTAKEYLDERLREIGLKK